MVIKVYQSTHLLAAFGVDYTWVRDDIEQKEWGVLVCIGVVTSVFSIRLAKVALRGLSRLLLSIAY